uniref:Acid sensing ion channel subunit family member 4 n=1 Tax=Anser brachyrhynchus TaxID=132585 RepID=A0A8B9CQ25_9AVES
MPIEIVCKIKFAEEDEKQKEKEEGDKESLIEEPARPRSRDLAAFASASTLHGLGHICRSGRLGVRQTLWALAFLASLAFFLYQAAKSALLYLEHPHVMALDEEAIREMVFPAITICNINRYRHSALTDADIFHLANMTGLPPKDRDGHKATDLLYPDPDMADIVNRTGHQLDDMLKSCNFSGENCSSRDFTVVYTRYGKCYTFNGDRRNPRVTRQGGMGNGLEIMLDIQQEEYLPIWRETNETSFEAGIRVQIHSQDEPPYIHQLGFGVSPGFQTFVSCQEQRLTYLPQPWGNCRASVQGEQTLPGYDTYSIAACRLQCEKEAVVRSCHCRMVHMPGNESICSPNVYIECADHTLDAAVEDSQERCSCPTPCNLTRYGKEISMVRIPNKGSARYLARKYNKNETYIRENFLVLDIFFEALNYEAIEQKKAYDLAGLLGDIGGQMGLFIGASILTILEILDYIYEVIRDRVSRLLRRSKPPLKKPSGSIATLGLEELKDQVPCRGGLRGQGPGQGHPSPVGTGRCSLEPGGLVASGCRALGWMGRRDGGAGGHPPDAAIPAEPLRDAGPARGGRLQRGHPAQPPPPPPLPAPGRLRGLRLLGQLGTGGGQPPPPAVPSPLSSRRGTAAPGTAAPLAPGRATGATWAPAPPRPPSPSVQPLRLPPACGVSPVSSTRYGGAAPHPAARAAPGPQLHAREQRGPRDAEHARGELGFLQAPPGPSLLTPPGGVSALPRPPRGGPCPDHRSPPRECRRVRGSHLQSHLHGTTLPPLRPLAPPPL